MDIKQLNKSELQIMKYLWMLEKGFMKDIVEKFPEPRPAYTTISTLMILKHNLHRFLPKTLICRCKN